MESVYGARKRGEAAPDLPLADAHVVCGILVFALALARLYLRLVRGAPPPPESEHPVLKFAAGATHALLYAIILAMLATGALAWFGDVSTAARLHAMAMPLVAFLVLLHTLAALYHHFVRKNEENLHRPVSPMHAIILDRPVEIPPRHRPKRRRERPFFRPPAAHGSDLRRMRVAAGFGVLPGRQALGAHCVPPASIIVLTGGFA